MAEQKKLLNDVVIIRPLAIFLLVVWHSFIIYTGGWSEPAGYMPIEGYWWLAKAAYAFMLELFVFIYGYVFCLSLQKKNPSFKNVVVGKIRRLIVPSIIFSLIYYFLFYDLAEFSVRGFVMNILNGCGHMWFLPMLFWTTLIAYLLNAIKCPEVVKVVIALGMVVLSFLPIPLRISSAFYYMFFFYVGMVMYKHKDAILSKMCNRWIYGVLLGVMFVIVFVVGTFIDRDVLPAYTASDSLVIKGIALLVSKYIRVVYALAGVFFIYVLVNTLLNIKNITLPNWIKELNTTCFGIYLFQQFVLQILYYKTSLPTIVGPYLLPWIGLIITLIISYILTKLTLKTKIGRELI